MSELNLVLAKKRGKKILGLVEGDLEEFLKVDELISIEEETFKYSKVIVDTLLQDEKWQNHGLKFCNINLAGIVTNILYHECIAWLERFKRIGGRVIERFSPEEVELVDLHWLWPWVFEGLLVKYKIAGFKTLAKQLLPESWIITLKNADRLAFLSRQARRIAPFSPNMGAKRLLLVTAGVRSVEYLDKVIQGLYYKGWSVIVAPCHQPLSLHMPGVTEAFPDYLPFSMVRHLRKYLKELSAMPNVIFPCKDQFYTLLSKKILGVIRGDICYNAAYWLAYVLWQVEYWKPHLIVTMDKIFAVGKAVTLVGKALDISTLLCPIGYVWDTPWLSGLQFTRIAVSGEADRDVLIKRGNDPHAVIVTGSLSLDSLGDYCGGYILKGKPAILLTSHDNPRIIPRYLRKKQLVSIIQAFFNLPESAVLTIKLHPLEQEEELLKLIGPFCNTERIRIVKNISVYPLIRSADLLITQASTTGIEAAAMGVPVLVVNFKPAPHIIPCVEQGVAIGATEPEDILPAMQRLLYDDSLKDQIKERRDGFLKKHLFALDGKAHVRIIELIETMAAR